ncbi:MULTISPECIES: roadblock/LC7 domain-containing protein [Deinococcus]|mgnify:CR=1 FL=1|uniref:Roadblock/LC7 domain-containing protein n=1 Tax=Deinococcus rufus TaxID=2136097 RepID=A0ABV7ZC25_9DEIO|nr:roadblock/LC7 domain-containing protein [Deinococcus sp. AB2017081]WQE94198.1 roadblock/LC7 domain-containing protein [Deinococcus sp. AB2017081]
MTASKTDRLDTALSALRRAMPDVRGALVATSDGLPIAKSFSDNTDASRVAAMAATANGLGKRISDTLGTGTLSEMSVAGHSGQVFFYTAGARAVLAVVTPPDANLGLLHMEARETAQAVAAIL